MKKITKALALFLVLVTVFSLVPQKTYAANPNFVTVTYKDGYNKDGKYWFPCTIESLHSYAYITIRSKIVNSAGNAVVTFKTAYLDPGETKEYGFGYNYSGLPTGTYTLIIEISNSTFDTYTWKRSVKHTEPAAQVTYKGHETYYNDNGVYMNKISFTCKNMKGQKVYCKIYNEYGDLMYDWGTDTTVRKTNGEVGFFAWTGSCNGEKQPSGEYTFVLTNSANKQVVEKTLKLKILGGNG